MSAASAAAASAAAAAVDAAPCDFIDLTLEDEEPSLSFQQAAAHADTNGLGVSQPHGWAVQGPPNAGSLA